MLIRVAVDNRFFPCQKEYPITVTAASVDYKNFKAANNNQTEARLLFLAGNMVDISCDNILPLIQGKVNYNNLISAEGSGTNAERTAHHYGIEHFDTVAKEFNQVIRTRFKYIKLSLTIYSLIR